MLQTLIQNLATLIVTVRKNMLSSIMTTFMILVIIVAWSARGNIASWMENNPSATQRVERISRATESGQKITTALTNDLVVLNADRVFIRQFHELEDPVSHISVPMASVTYLVTAPGVSSTPSALQPMPRGRLSDLVDGIWADPAHPICIRRTVEEIRDPVYRSRLVEGGVAVLFACPVLDIDGTPIGIIHASYITMTKARPADDVIFARLSTTSVRIAGFLAEVTAPERETWYRKLLSW